MRNRFRNLLLWLLAVPTLSACDCGGRTARRAPPTIHLSTTLLDFGRVRVGQSALRTLSISNSGQDPLEISGLLFEQETPTFSTTIKNLHLEGGEEAALVVRFDPGKAQQYAGRIVVESDASNAGVMAVELRGDATEAGGDGGPPPQDGGQDAGIDAGTDAGVDAGWDAGPPPDGGNCLGAQPGTVKWVYSGTGTIFSSPALGADGTIYYGTSGGKLLAFWPDGTPRWSMVTGGGQLVASSPAIDPTGTIYFGTYDSKLYAVGPAGSIKWSFTTGGEVNSSPAIGANGDIYVGSGDGKLYAIQPSGAQRWAYNAGAYIYSSPAVGPDGVIYVGTKSPGTLLAINPNGTLRWAYSIGATDLDSSPAIGTDGTIYIGADDGKLYAITATGSLKWATSIGSQAIDSSPALAPDGTIYVGSWSDVVAAVNPGGTLRWSFATSATVGWSSPVVGADGTVFIGTKDAHSASQPNRLLALQPDGGLRWELTVPGFIDTTPALASDGTLYFGSWEGKLYAVCSGSQGLAKSTWPRFHHDSLQTGRLPGCTIEVDVQCTANGASYTISVDEADPGTIQFVDPGLGTLTNFCMTKVGPLNTTVKSGTISASYSLGTCLASEHLDNNACSTSKGYTCP